MPLSSHEAKIDVENAQSNTMVCKGNMNFDGKGKKMREARATRSRELQPFASVVGLLGGFHRADSDGVVFFGPSDGYFGASLLVERVKRWLVAGVERIDLIANDECIFRSLGDTGSRARRWIARHCVFGAAHRVANGAGEVFSLGRKGSGKA
jgi:hypothetical protein